MELRDKIKELIIAELDEYDYNEAKEWFDDPYQHNPQNGCISGLIYYSDTEPIAREYHDEIIELMGDFEYGKPLRLNDMTWFAFEALLPELKDEVIEELYGNDD